MVVVGLFLPVTTTLKVGTSGNSPTHWDVHWDSNALLSLKSSAKIERHPKLRVTFIGLPQISMTPAPPREAAREAAREASREAKEGGEEGGEEKGKEAGRKEGKGGKAGGDAGGDVGSKEVKEGKGGEEGGAALIMPWREAVVDRPLTGISTPPPPPPPPPPKPQQRPGAGTGGERSRGGGGVQHGLTKQQQVAVTGALVRQRFIIQCSEICTLEI